MSAGKAIRIHGEDSITLESSLLFCKVQNKGKIIITYRLTPRVEHSGVFWIGNRAWRKVKTC